MEEGLETHLDDADPPICSARGLPPLLASAVLNPNKQKDAFDVNTATEHWTGQQAITTRKLFSSCAWPVGVWELPFPQRHQTRADEQHQLQITFLLLPLAALLHSTHAGSVWLHLAIISRLVLVKEQGAGANCSTCPAGHSSSSTDRPPVNGAMRHLHTNPQKPRPSRGEKQRIVHSSSTSWVSPDQRLVSLFHRAQPRKGSGDSCRAGANRVLSLLCLQYTHSDSALHHDLTFHVTRWIKREA